MKQYWLAFLRHAHMHYWTIPIVLNMSSKALGIAPCGCTFLWAADAPSAEAIHGLLQLKRLRMSYTIDEGVAKVCRFCKIYWKVDEVILTWKASGVQKVEQHIS